VLTSWQLDHLIDDAQLLTTELVNNAVVHARSRVLVNLEHDPDALRVEVTDVGGGVLQPVDTGLDETHGRGLMLVAAMSCAWGTVFEGDAKTVWFELRAPTTPDPADAGPLTREPRSPRGSQGRPRTLR
jgi:hypothetical protein